MNNFTGSFEFWKSFLNTKIVMSWGWIIMYLANTGLVLINFYENFKNKKTNIVEEIKEEEKTEE